MSRRRLRTTALMACLAVSTIASARQAHDTGAAEQVRIRAHQFGEAVRQDSSAFGHRVAYSARQAGHQFNFGMHQIGARFHHWWDGLKSQVARTRADSYREPRWI